MPDPAPTDASTSAAGSGAGALLWRIEHRSEVDSTNRVLLDAARVGEPAGAVLVADFQHAGRGRLGRTWNARAGSALLVSILVKPDLAPERLGVVTMAAGLALAEAVEQVCGVRPGLKWPNDLVVGDRKLAGILAESVECPAGSGTGAAPASRAVVVGIGANLSDSAVPPELRERATSCAEVAGRSVDRDDLLRALLAALGRRLGSRTALDGVVAEYRERLGTLGRRVRATVGRRAVEGVAVGVDDSGGLEIRRADGVVETVAVGDVEHLRPADTA